MAQHQPERAEEPRVHPGGRLEPVPESETPEWNQSVDAGIPWGEGDGDTASGEEASPDAATEEALQAAREASRNRQQRRRRLLHDCERLLLLDFDTLAMPGWPDHHQLNLARRRRDSWLLLVSVLAAVVLAGMGNLVPALIGGVAFGGLALVALWGLPGVRHVFTHHPSYMELLLKRRRLLHRARKHVEHLEGPIGLAAACRPLAEYNPALRRSRYTGLYSLSERGQLVDSIRNRAQAQLYLIFALEAEKAYNRLREEYLRTHEQMLDQGEVEPLDAAAQATDPSLVPVPESDPGAGAPESADGE
ncbi:hypothetical protein [Vreelandella utahensis]|uniref:hypothetical protein n=1 Tax=Vreelandella halophila TaxID=86177 RepID=UPI000986F9CA|nr:hypothetical protein [Halomonas utahensis]